MILRDWLTKNDIKPYTFAKSIGMASATIYKNLSGQQRMSARFAVKVEAKTLGQVSRAEAIWPEDYAINKNGHEQLTVFPKMIHQDAKEKVKDGK